MPKGSEELIAARKGEIITACTGHGSGKGLRDAVHDGRQRIPGEGLQIWKIAEVMIKRMASLSGGWKERRL